jgi:hypothetical protein
VSREPVDHAAQRAVRGRELERAKESLARERAQVLCDAVALRVGRVCGRNADRERRFLATVVTPPGQRMMMSEVEVMDLGRRRMNILVPALAQMFGDHHARVKEAESPPIEPMQERKRLRKPLFFCVAILGVLCAGLGLYAWYGGRTRVRYQIAEKKTVKSAQLADQSLSGAENEPANQITNDAINQAKEELRKGAAAKEPAVTPTPSAAKVGGDRQLSSGPVFTPYIVRDTILTGDRDAGTPARVAGQADSETGARVGRGAAGASDAGQPYYRSSTPAAFSIYAVTPETRASATSIPARSPKAESRSATPAPALASVKLPPFSPMTSSRICCPTGLRRRSKKRCHGCPQKCARSRSWR